MKLDGIITANLLNDSDKNYSIVNNNYRLRQHFSSASEGRKSQLKAQLVSILNPLSLLVKFSCVALKLCYVNLKCGHSTQSC